MMQLYSSDGDLKLRVEVSKHNEELQGIEDILKEFQDYFEELKALPSPRARDHGIPSRESAQPTSICPFRHLAPKDVIEQMAREMLEEYGIIQHNHCLFSSSSKRKMVLGTKWRLLKGGPSPTLLSNL